MESYLQIDPPQTCLNRTRRSEPSLCQWCCRPTQLFRKFASTRQVNRYGIQCSGHLDFGVPLQQFLSELQTCRTDVCASINVGLCKIRHPATSSNSIVEWNCRLPKQPPTSNKNCNPTASRTRTSWVSCTVVYSKPNCYCLLLFNFPRLYWPLFIQHPNHNVNPQNPDALNIPRGHQNWYSTRAHLPIHCWFIKIPGWSQAIPTCFTSIRAAAPCSRAIRATMDSAFWRAMPWQPMSICWSDSLSCSSWRTGRATCFRGLQWMDLQ